MNYIMVVIFAASAALAKGDQFYENFEKNNVGESPQGWSEGKMGENGKSEWKVEQEPGSAPNRVLRRRGDSVYNWFVKDGLSFKDGILEARLKVHAGKTDPEGGLIWRFHDGQNYSYMRINILENNIIYYRMNAGKKELVKSVDVPVPTGVWHKIQVRLKGPSLTISFNGKKLISLTDTQNTSAGKAGFFSTADTDCSFDDWKVLK